MVYISKNIIIFITIAIILSITYKLLISFGMYEGFNDKTNDVQFAIDPIDGYECSAICGGGTRTRTVTCTTLDGTIVDDSLCLVNNERPEITESCNERPCGVWEYGPWEGCENKRNCVLDGDIPKEIRAEPTCSLGEGMCPQAYDEPLERDCTDIVCGTYEGGDWGVCSKSCGTGTKTRIVNCVDSEGNIVDYNLCSHLDNLLTSKDCNKFECNDWEPPTWGVCSKPCNTGTQTTNEPVCAEGNICSEENKPIQQTRDCNTKECVWNESSWGFSGEEIINPSEELSPIQNGDRWSLTSSINDSVISLTMNVVTNLLGGVVLTSIEEQMEGVPWGKITISNPEVENKLDIVISVTTEIKNSYKLGGIPGKFISNLISEDNYEIIAMIRPDQVVTVTSLVSPYNSWTFTRHG